ncbi:MAG: polyamine aminopropyltransferase [Acidobacteria bacterium]|nr:polyamine aminopropyltransferase [Acidobacteriota bacterium]
MFPLPIRPRTATILLALSMFFTGAAGFIFECILGTVASYILGNSIEQFSVTISLMMLMMGVAGWWQSRLSDDRLIEKFLAVEAGLALLGGFAPIAVYGAYATMETHFALAQYFFVTSIGFLIGLEIPLVLRINRRFAPQLKSNIATVFSTDYVGAFLGALVWAFFLLRYFPLTETSFLAAGLNFLVAAATYLYFSVTGAVSHQRLAFGLVALTAAALSFGYSRNQDWSRLFEQRFYDRPIVVSSTTRYQHIVMTASVDPLDYRLYLNGNLQFSSVDERIYHEMLVHPAMALVRDPRQVLILGGGDGLGMREVLKHSAVQQAVLVDIDPEMIDLARTNPVFTELNEGALQDARVHLSAEGLARPTQLESTVYEVSHRRAKPPGEGVEEAARVQVYTVDADRMADQLPVDQDVVIIDLPDPNTIELTKLYSLEFYLKLRRRLNPGAVMVVQSTSPYHAKESYLCIRRTLEAAGFATLPYHDNVPSFGDWGWILAWEPERREGDLLAAIEALGDFRVEPSRLTYLTPAVFRAALSFGKGALDSPQAELNRLMQPALLRFYLAESWRSE